MQVRQQFVVQLRITEVQWNQRLLVLGAILLAGRRTTIIGFAAKKLFCRSQSRKR